MPFGVSGFWLKLSLALSLALNLAVVGLVAGALLHRRDVVQTLPLDPGRGLFGLIAMLPPERRAELREGLGAPPPRAALAAQWADLRGTLLQPEVSAVELQARLAQIRVDQGARATDLETALATELARMSLAERNDYVARLERLRPGGLHREMPGRDGDHPPRGEFRGEPRPGRGDPDRWPPQDELGGPREPPED